MATDASAKATPLAAPPAAAPAAPKPVTPAIPKAQAASAPPAAAKPPVTAVPPSRAPAAATTTPPGTPRPPETIEQGIRKVSAEIFEKKTPEAPVGTETKPAATEGTPPVTETKPAAAATEADPFAHIAPPEGMTEKSLVGWKALKTEAATKLAAAQKAHSEAVAQLEVMKKATPADVADVAKLKADLQTAHDRLAILDIKSTPDFQNQFVAPREKALAEAQTVLTDNAIEGAPKMGDLLDKPRAEFAKTVSELAKQLPAYDQAAFAASMREAYRLHGEEKGVLDKAGEFQRNLQAKMAQTQRNAFDTTWKEFGDKVKPLPMPDNATAEVRADVDAYNTEMASIRTRAEQFAFGKLDEKGVSDMAAKAATLDFMAGKVIPRMQREFDQAAALIQDLTTELTAIKGKKNPGTFDAGDAPGAVDTSKMSIHELSLHMFGKGKPGQP